MYVLNSIVVRKIVLFLILVPFLLHSQDTLYTKLSPPLAINTVSINRTSVKYKRYSNLQGPHYVIDKKDVVCIKFASGKIDSLLSQKIYNKEIKVIKNENYFRRNIISANIYDLTQEAITLNYEYIFGKGEVRIKIPFSLGFDIFGGTNKVKHKLVDQNSFNYFYYNRKKNFSTGIDIKYCPKPKRTIKTFTGLSFEFGSIEYYYPVYHYNVVAPFYLTGKSDAEFYSLILDYGADFTISKHFHLNATAGIGMSHSKLFLHDLWPQPAEFNMQTLNTLQYRIGVSLGYLF